MNQLVPQSQPARVLCALPSDPPYDLPPSAVTATVFDGDGAELVAAHAVTVSAWALSAGAAVGARSIAVSSWGSARVPQPGELLLLAAASAPAQRPREKVIIERVDGTTVTLREPLELAHATGATATALVARVALTSVHTATLARNLRVRLAATLPTGDTSDNTWLSDTLFDIVVHVPRNPLTPEYLKRYASNTFNDLMGWADQLDGGFQSLCHGAFERVLDRLWNEGENPDLRMADSQLATACLEMVRHLAAEDGIVPPGVDPMQYRQHALDRMNHSIGDLRRSVRWVDSRQDAKPTDSNTRRDMSTIILGF